MNGNLDRCITPKRKQMMNQLAPTKFLFHLHILSFSLLNSSVRGCIMQSVQKDGLEHNVSSFTALVSFDDMVYFFLGKTYVKSPDV